MIEHIEAKNFLSYEDLSVSLSNSDKIINIVGDNGVGKSALLEIIPYALFGESRVPFGNLIRTGQDSMSVHVRVSGVDIRRSRKASSSSSSLQVVYEDKMYQNKEATAFLQQHFGMDYFMFSMVSFFGMGSGDQLFTAGNKTRISYLQRVANISLYMKLAKHTSKINRENVLKYRESKAGLDEMNELYRLEYSSLEDSVSSLQKEVEKLRESKENLQDSLRESDKERDRISLLLVEKRRLLKAIADLEKEMSSKEMVVEAKALQLEEMRQRKATTLSEAENVHNFLQKNGRGGVAKLSRLIVRVKSKIELLRLGIENVQKKCPLCQAELPATLVDEWKGEVTDRSEYVGKLENAHSVIQRTIENVRDVDHGYTMAKNEKSHLDNELRSLKTKHKHATMRVDKITSEVSGYYKRTRLDEVEQELNQVNNRLADNRAKLNLQRTKLRKKEEWSSRMDVRKRECKAAGLRMDVTAALTDIFSQKGIPLQLLRDICLEIAWEATDIFKMFDYGEILIKGMEEDNLSFYLETVSGVYHFAQLSAGQKALLSLSVRLALSNICFRYNPNAFDFMLLDEVTTCLSSSKVASLSGVFSDMLKGNVNQVFVISHVAIPNLQPDSTLNVSIHSGVSTLKDD